MSAEDDKAGKKRGKPDRAAASTPAADAPAPAKKAARKRSAAAKKKTARGNVGNEPATASPTDAAAPTMTPATDPPRTAVFTTAPGEPQAPVESASAPATPAAAASADAGPAVPATEPASRARRAGESMTGESVAGESVATAPDAAVADRPLLLRTRLDVRWGDMDAFNHVNNAVFLTYLEEARLRWLQALPGPWLDDNTAPLLAAAHVNYRRPIEWPSRVSVELYADRAGNSSLTIGHRVLDARDPEIVYSDGHTVMVWIDRRNGKASRLPPAVRQACVAGVRRDRGNG